MLSVAKVGPVRAIMGISSDGAVRRTIPTEVYRYGFTTEARDGNLEISMSPVGAENYSPLQAMGNSTDMIMIRNKD